MSSLFWTGYSGADRYATISALQSIISPFGDITGFQPFSDLALTVTIELPERHADGLYAALCKVMTMDAAAPLASDSARERTVFLNVSFARGTGNLRTETPAVPG